MVLHDAKCLIKAGPVADTSVGRVCAREVSSLWRVMLLICDWEREFWHRLGFSWFIDGLGFLRFNHRSGFFTVQRKGLIARII